MPNLTVNGINVHYQDTQEDKPAIIFNHGFFMDSTMFDAQTEALRDQYRIVSIDARGHGATSDGGEPFTYWDLAKDTLGIMDALGIDTAVLGGMSQGGFTALRAALLAPERFTALVLISTEAQATPEAKKAGYYELFATWEQYGPVDGLMEGLSGQLIGDAAFTAPWIAKWKQIPYSQIAHAGTNLIERDDVTDRLGELTMPALVVSGSQDAGLPFDDQVEFAQALNAKGLVVFDAGHSLNVTKAAEFNEVLLDFLATLPVVKAVEPARA